MTTDDVLAHYGVLGMKWGVRRENRISKRMASGMSRTQAEKKEETRKKIIAATTVATVAVAGAAYLANKQSVDAFLTNTFNAGKKVSDASKSTTSKAGEKYVVDTFKKIASSQQAEAKYHIGHLTQELDGYKASIKKTTNPTTVKMYRDNIKEVQASIASWENFAEKALSRM